MKPLVEFVAGLALEQCPMIYLSGSISRDPQYRAKFTYWENLFSTWVNVRCINPVRLLPKGHTYDEYMEVDLMFVRRAAAIVMLPCWKNSPGAKAERAYAESLGKRIIEIPDVYAEVKIPMEVAA